MRARHLAAGAALSGFLYGCAGVPTLPGDTGPESTPATNYNGYGMIIGWNTEAGKTIKVGQLACDVDATGVWGDRCLPARHVVQAAGNITVSVCHRTQNGPDLFKVKNTDQLITEVGNALRAKYTGQFVTQPAHAGPIECIEQLPASDEVMQHVKMGDVAIIMADPAYVMPLSYRNQ